MAAQGPTEYTADEEHSFCNRLGYWISGSIQAHKIWSVQIAIIFSAVYEIQHRFASREEKFEIWRKRVFEFWADEDPFIDTENREKSTMTRGDTFWRKWQEIRKNFATLSFLIQKRPRIFTSFLVNKFWRRLTSNSYAMFTSQVSRRRIQPVKSWLMEWIYLVNQPVNTKTRLLFQSHPFNGNTKIQHCATCWL